MEVLTKAKPKKIGLTPKTKKILIALDYDSNAQDIAKQGYSLAEALKADVILLHVVADFRVYSTYEFAPLSGFSGLSNNDFIDYPREQGLMRRGEHLLAQIKLDHQNPATETLVVEGDFSETIIKTAHQNQADIIVIGSHRKQWLEKLVWGSVAHEVLLHSDIPVFIIPIKQE